MALRVKFVILVLRHDNENFHLVVENQECHLYLERAYHENPFAILDCY